MADFERLEVWRVAHEVCLAIYSLLGKLPSEERFALNQQLRRAAVSIPANIVEGNERQAANDFAHFMDIAIGSAAELRYFLILMRNLGYATDSDIAVVGAKLAGLVRMLREFRDGGREARLQSAS
jgi:four helix bundle protein